MDDDLKNLTTELGKISEDVKASFGSLTAEQINWKPSAESWSVGQCFEHLVKTNSLFLPVLEKIERGEYKNSFLENYSPLSGFFGNLLIKSLRKDERKFKAPSQAIVPPSEIDANVIEQFAAHQTEMIDRIKRMENAGWKKIKITSPFMKLMTYKLEDGFIIIVEHEKRHFRQAERVLKADGFPH